MLGPGLRLIARCPFDALSRDGHCSSPRTPCSPVTCSSHSPRISRRRWGAPHAAPTAAAEPLAPPTPSGGEERACSSVRLSNNATPQQQPTGTSMHECVDIMTQSLAVNLTLDEYRQLNSICLAGQLATGAQPGGQQMGVGTAPSSLSHLTISSSDLESMQLCDHCRYPCYLSGMPACQASHYLQMWDADAILKPRGFDASTSLRLHGVADIAAVSSGGRANGQWKPDNQDSFLVQPTASAASTAGTAGSAADTSAGAAAIGVFDGHGRLGASAAAIVRQAMAEQLAVMRDTQEEAAGGVQGAASLLDSCFSAADEAMQASGRDWSKSGCTAVLALLDQDSLSVAWAGDSRAVLGICSTSGSHMASFDASSAPASSAGDSSAGRGAASFSSSSASLSASSGSFDGYGGPMCAAVPLTEDHKPNQPTERERISAAGGRVTRLATDRFGNPAGPYRVFVPDCWSPGLALSRAFGDTLAASVGVTSKPEVTVLPLPSAPHLPAPSHSMPLSGVSNGSTASCCSLDAGGGSQEAAAGTASSERHVLIVASDGLWEWVSNGMAVAIAAAASSAEDAAHALVEAAQKQWAVRYRGRNCDDITVVCAFLDR